MREQLSQPPLPATMNSYTGSAYTLATVREDPEESAALLSHANSNYGTLSDPERQQQEQEPEQAEEGFWSWWNPESRSIMFKAALKMAVVFIVSCVILGGTLKLALPTLEEEDRPDLKIPKSFAELQALNHLLKKYRDIYPYRILLCYVITYFFLQAFSLPGSMYLSILAGAVWGMARALPLACACVATGATLCYLISAALGPAILTIPKWRARLEQWTVKVDSQRSNLIPFLIVIRIAPFPPHWVVNVICPHVGIGIPIFWIGTFLGIFGVTVIHTTIGSGLDDMTSAADFHLISWKNFFLLSAVVVGVLIPVGLRYVFQGQVQTPTDVEPTEPDASRLESDDDSEDTILAHGPPTRIKAKQDARLIFLDDDDASSDPSELEEDEDVILEAGPTIVIKPKDSAPGP